MCLKENTFVRIPGKTTMGKGVGIMDFWSCIVHCFVFFLTLSMGRFVDWGHLLNFELGVDRWFAIEYDQLAFERKSIEIWSLEVQSLRVVVMIE